MGVDTGVDTGVDMEVVVMDMRCTPTHIPSMTMATGSRMTTR